MIAGLETITSGRLEIGGKDVSSVEPAQRDIAMVFQNYALYPHMSVRQNLAYGLKNRRVPRAEIDSRIADTAALLGIEQLMDRRPAQLSGGQRQRVAMGRAIIRDPALFLFDEPLSNLDAKLRIQMRVEIRHLQRRLNTTSIYVTHDQLEAMTLADRLVVMNGGLVEQVGPSMDVFERPETAFVAGFIGSPPMNMIEITPGKKALSSLPNFNKDTDLIGIRPDAIRLTGDDQPAISFSGSVQLLEPVGGETHVHMMVGGIDTPIVASLPGRVAASEGQNLTCYVEYEHIHPFNRQTGLRTD
jgi:sn-glycerol 3-phosphate transport system ATP-binding protein